MNGFQKILWALCGGLALLLVGAVAPNNNPTTRYDAITITDDIAAEDLTAGIVGGCLYAVEIKCTDDDAIAFTINSANGTELYSVTTTGAIAGEYHIVDNFFPINAIPNYTVTGYSDSVGCKVEVTAWQR